MSVNPEDLFEALVSLEWTREDRQVPTSYEVWESPDGLREALIPLDQSAGDYMGLLERASSVVRRSDPHLFDQIVREHEMKRGADLAETRWQKETSLPSGLITWLSGEEMHLRAREQLSASAKATAEKRRYHGNHSAFLAKSFLDSSYMAAPAAGSFIVTALTPARLSFYVSQAAEKRAQSSDARLMDPEKVSGAEILRTYETALDALSECLRSYAKTPRVEPFLEAVSSGVSYEMTKSLSELVAGGDTSITIMREGRRREPKQVIFEAPSAQVLARATTALSRDVEPMTVSLLGEVTLLSRQHGGGERVIRLDVTAGGGGAVRKARVRLDAEQYERALAAHQREGFLRVQGLLEREGNLYWMYSPTTVDIVDPSPPADIEGPADVFEQPELPDRD